MISGVGNVAFEMFLTDKTLIPSLILAHHCLNERVKVGKFTCKSQSCFKVEKSVTFSTA